MKQKNCLDLRKYFFSARVVDRWNRLDQKDIDNDIDTVNGFKRRLDNIRNTKRMGFLPYGLVPPSLKASLDWTIPLLVWPHQINYQVNVWSQF